LQTERDAKAELNRRSQACEVLTVTGIRVAEKWTNSKRRQKDECRMKKTVSALRRESFILPSAFCVLSLAKTRTQPKQ
jgi:hypothetical protein